MAQYLVHIWLGVHISSYRCTTHFTILRSPLIGQCSFYDFAHRIRTHISPEVTVGIEVTKYIGGYMGQLTVLSQLNSRKLYLGQKIRKIHLMCGTVTRAATACKLVFIWRRVCGTPFLIWIDDPQIALLSTGETAVLLYVSYPLIVILSESLRNVSCKQIK